MQGQLFTQDFLLHGIRATPPYLALEAAAFAAFEVRLRGMLQSKIQYADGVQIYGEVNGRVGDHYQALGGKLGVRLEW